MNTEVPVALTFDVEEHHRIEAAAHLDCTPELRAEYAGRMDDVTRWLLDVLDERGIKATFFVVGQIADSHPGLVRKIADSGHEVASHSWDHRRVARFTPRTFRDDVRKSKDALEQVTGDAVLGFRAPTFSITRATPWAIDVLADLGMKYDSSIFPVKHDRYGIHDAPTTPFRARGEASEVLEFPPLTLREFGANLPVAGGGYFRLFPLWVMERGIRAMTRLPRSASVVYFHPWEFDPDQPKLPLRTLSKFRTYVGTGRSRERLTHLLTRHRFGRMCDLAVRFIRRWDELPTFSLAPQTPTHALEAPVKAA